MRYLTLALVLSACDDGTSATSQTLDTTYSKLRTAQIVF